MPTGMPQTQCFHPFSDTGPPTVDLLAFWVVSMRCEKTCSSDRPKIRPKILPKLPRCKQEGAIILNTLGFCGSLVPQLAHARVKDKLVQKTRIRGKSGKLERPVNQKESLRDLTRLWARGPANSKTMFENIFMHPAPRRKYGQAGIFDYNTTTQIKKLFS